MTIIYVCESNCNCLAVTSRNERWIRIQRLEDVSGDDNIIYEVNPMETFIGKSENCKMTEFRELEIERYSMEIQFYLK